MASELFEHFAMRASGIRRTDQYQKPVPSSFTRATIAREVGRKWLNGAASESNRPSVGLPRRTGFEDFWRNRWFVLAEKVEEHAEELVELLLDAARAGEWRVVQMMLDRVFGKPTERVEQTVTRSRTGQELENMSPEELDAELARLERALADGDSFIEPTFRPADSEVQ